MNNYKLQEGWYEEDYYVLTDTITGIRLREKNPIIGFGFHSIFFYNGHIDLPRYYATQLDALENLKWLINKCEVEMSLKAPTQRVPTGYVEKENSNQLMLLKKNGDFLSCIIVTIHKDGGIQEFKCRDENYKYYPPEQILAMLSYTLKTKEGIFKGTEFHIDA